MMTETLVNSRVIIVAVVYLSIFLDNVLLTVVVPIIPDYLCTLDGNNTSTNTTDENGRVGLLLSSKALVQLVLNPVVGILTSSLGYTKPLLFGNLSLLLSTLLFAFGRTYETLFLARSIQGVSSACIGVTGMSLVASQYPEEDKRSKVMGFVLGSIALGVLLGYPIGSVLYDLEGKMAPFLLIATFILVSICLLIFTLDIQIDAETMTSKVVENETSWTHLLLDPHILIVCGAIWCSTSPMAILEPCLPIWLLSHIRAKKWQLGTVFIPDSVGYFVGTNFFGGIAYRYGRSKVAVIAMLVVGISAILIPSADTVAQLIVPHLCLGLGIGVADAALVPLLASLVDGNYGPVYSLQQVAVSLAYSLGPIMGGEMVRTVGFQWVMRIAGLTNVAYCPLLVYLALRRKKSLVKQAEKDEKNYETFHKPVLKYQRFHDSDDDL